MSQLVTFRIPELSVAVGAVNVAVALVDTPPLGDTFTVDGHVSVGATLSAITIEIEQLAVLLALSLAVHVTDVVVSTLNRVVPESGHEMLWMPEPSVALTSDTNDTVTSGRPSEDCVVYVTLVGQLMTGGMVSLMVTVNVHELESPPLFFAVQLTLVMPRGNRYGVCDDTAGTHAALKIPLPSLAAKVGVYDVKDTYDTPPLGDPT